MNWQGCWEFERGMNMSGTPWKTTEVQRMAQMYLNGYSSNEIGKDLGRSGASVSRQLTVMGISTDARNKAAHNAAYRTRTEK